ncbi:receptor-like protein 6, partial [Quercus suber]
YNHTVYARDKCVDRLESTKFVRQPIAIHDQPCQFPKPSGFGSTKTFEPQLMKAMFIGLFPPEPTINSITSLILHCITPPMKIPYFSWLFLIPICSLFVSFGIFVVSGQCLGDQRSYLLDLKNSLPNNTWSTKLVRWNESADCCFWEGVTCSREGRVIGLNLFNESITAGLDSSSSLFSLQYLENLNLAYNCFNSPIPKEFRKLKNLSYLNLSNACFAGQIPNAISSLTRLVTLDLSTNYFLADSTLKLEDPNLAMLVQNLSELKELYLDGVTISVQGYEWCQALSSSLPNLRVLSMSGCSLSGPFEFSLSKLQFLSIISLHNNPFYAPVPEFFANFTNLTSLELSFCGLNGTFPKKIFQIQTLQKLDLSGNDLLQGSLPEFLSNGSLRSLLLGSTNFSGTLPNSISNLTMLSRIDLSLCNFSGSIPSSMANLTQLVYLDMSSNNFTGPIPSFSKIHFLNWEGLLNLVNLELSHNSLEGYIPVSLFSLPSLQILRLSNNHFSGQLNEFSNVSSCQLKTLDLSSNYLEGPIPMSIFELQGIEILLLSSNKFNGSLQFNVIQQLRNLFDLDLSYNSLLIEYNGTSSSLSSLFQVIELKLASCKLKIFPDFLINLSNLTTLDLSNNQIHGEIPNWIWKFNKLTHLDLSFNQLVMKREGPLLSLSSLTTLNFLDLHSNQLEGKLPVLPPYATYLDFSINNFNSVIPASIGDSLGVAYFFSISSNKFHGDIPQSLCYATYLQVLNLSNNTLNGTIPQCLIEMSKNLGVLDNYISAELGFIFGFWVVVGPLVYWKRWRIQYYKHVDDILIKIFPHALKYIRAPGNEWCQALSSSAPNLRVLSMINCYLSGPFDSSLSKLRSLSIIHLDGNPFNASVPEFFANSVNLTSLHLSFCGLNGTFPENVFQILTLQTLDLSNNKLLKGALPDAILIFHTTAFRLNIVKLTLHYLPFPKLRH